MGACAWHDLNRKLALQVLTGSALQGVLGSQADRIPDLFVEPVPGVVYTTSVTKVSDHGG